MRPGSREFYRWTKPPLWLLGLAPLAWMVLGAFGLAGVSLGANPVEKLLDEAGLWSLRILLLTLAVTPLRVLTGWTWLLGYRRLLGLFAFFYLCLHLTVYLALDRALDLGLVLEDVVERPFITLGALAFLAMVPLAVTSTRGWMRRLGKRWQKLHRLVYVIAILGVWHYYWQVKLDTVEPTIYALILAVLLAFRARETWLRRRRQRERLARKAQARKAAAYSATETASSS
ncbi:MAG: protein-methionine-sulfoxide reductase heme-binding subunit MsrQ [Xanthomonadales bacterium]|jgi:sulfoxide reductase heme-binding subunit YedZ|nr:protein-methionine-sulfoxide reductase heme-binding subunit MsrQ [Xanthomonadales bacterium]